MLLKLAKSGVHKDLEQNSWFFLIEEFQNLTDRQAEFVALVSDWESPVPKQLETKERRKLAAMKAGWRTRGDRHLMLDTRGLDIVDGKVASVEAAIKRYQELQLETNPDYRMLKVLDDRIAHLQIMVSNESDDADEQVKLSKLTKELFELYEDRKAFERKIKTHDPLVHGDDFGDPEEGTDRNLSLIDKVNEERI